MKTIREYGLAMAVLVFFLAGCTPRPGGDEHGHEEAMEPQEERGPHGGRLLVDGDVALEVTIFERGVPPEFRVYPFLAGQPLTPREVDMTIELHRFGGRADTVGFTPQEDYLRGQRTVEEPHSFDVVVSATHGGRSMRWTYESYEGRTEMSAAVMAASGITLATAGPARIRTTVRAYGRVTANEDRVAQLAPRYPGVVMDVRKRLGDTVEAGEILAVVESNQSLRGYEMRAPLRGTIVAKHGAPGEFVGEGEVIYTIADLTTLWVDLNVVPADVQRLRVAQSATIVVLGAPRRAQGHIVYLSPSAAETTQTVVARIAFDNPGGEWRPGFFATAEIVTDEVEVPVAVNAGAVQTFRDWNVVFLHDGSVFQATPVEIGRRDGEWVEITGGLTGGERYASEHSFIVKADVGKSGASHDH